ncbi:MAG TPA: nucleotidyltransferase family protein [Candidatus Krumholzibacteria bacterium]|nr:nucleotidyltransferase family protein [Candidatus Krumholzibacteria bacterium]
MTRRPAHSLRAVLARCMGLPGAQPWVDAATIELATSLGLAAVTAHAVTTGAARAGAGGRWTERLVRAAAREQALVLASEDEASRVVARLHGAGIPSIALKGLASNAVVHAPHGWCRAPGDVDLLVPGSRADEARALFAADPAYAAVEDLEAEFYENHHHLQPFVRRDRAATPIELHRRISGVTTGDVRIDHEGCWARAVAHPSLGPGALRLDDVDQCLATIIHIDRDDAYMRRARQLLDLALWWERCADRREDLWARAERWNATSTVERALTVLDAFLGGSRTTGRHDATAPSRGTRLWRMLALDSVTFADRRSVFPGWYRNAVLRALIHEQDPGRVLSRIVRPVLGGPPWDRGEPGAA